MGYVRVGTETDGDPAMLAETPAKWWQLFARYAAARLPGVKLVIIQARGGYSGSAGTHADGWAVDLQTWHLTDAQIDKLVALSRSVGGVAWLRNKQHGGFESHIHIAIDSGGAYTNCQYQVEAARNGYDGLGYRGRRGRDYHSAPSGGWKTAAQGIQAMINHLVTEEDDLPYASKDLQLISESAIQAQLVQTGRAPKAGDLADMIVERLLDRRLGLSGPPVKVALQDSYGMAVQHGQRLDQIEQRLAALEGRA